MPLPNAAAIHPLIQLPDAPADLVGEVKVWQQPVDILTYLPQAADPNPMFLEKRVYQGSSGRVYPLPFIDRIATEPVVRQWQAVHIENEYIRLMILPEIGGRIHIGYDKTTGYDFFYRQNVIKPALVGLAGPWASGGVEFNWPQHHRPATFMPVEIEIEHHTDGSATVWCSDHDPMLRMKGMHGVCVSPVRAVLDLKVRLFNRTPYTQTFLWWANVATRVHEQYQSFFPPDVASVADHAKRAVTTFPRSRERYYGVDYPGRARDGVPADEAPRLFIPDGSYPPDDLSWYANIPVPTSYMITGTESDFFGGYDHAAKTGVVHVANHHIAPGKKQWTWGNHEFGYAWDRCLTDHDGPYIELMAGVYTDNQPDFSWLAPWETKTFVQSWFPIHGIGVPIASNTAAALSLRSSDGVAFLGLYVTSNRAEVTVILRSGTAEIARWTQAVEVRHPLQLSVKLDAAIEGSDLAVMVTSGGKPLIDYDPTLQRPAPAIAAAIEPPSPEETTTMEELYLTGLHLLQYRHATRLPELYWREALARDPYDSRVNNALGLWHLRRAEFAAARQHFQAAIDRLTRLNPNPSDGEPYYNLGLTERLLNRDKEAYDALYKATWSAAWRGPAYLALAEIDASRGDWSIALDHAQRSLRCDADNLVARNLVVTTLHRLGRQQEAEAAHREIRALDLHDIASRWRDGVQPADGQQRLDLAFDLLRSGQKNEAAKVLRSPLTTDNSGSCPIELFLLAQIEGELADAPSEASWQQAATTSLTYCFPSRLEEFCVLQSAILSHPGSASAHLLLGNLLYDRRRHEEAIHAWETAAALDPSLPTVWRNLGIGLFNIRKDEAGALAAFARALETDPADARIFYERDQLWKRIGERPERRLAELERHLHLVRQRDDLSVELATLYNQTGQPAEALRLLLDRHFQPWEGGEGLVLAQYTRASSLLGQEALNTGDLSTALRYFDGARHPPQNLSEARHLLANDSDIAYWLGVVYSAQGDHAEATIWWQRAARSRGNFQQMAVRDLSDRTFWSGMALLRLGLQSEARALFQRIDDYARELSASKPTIDYFATSLPAMLLFEEDLDRRNQIDALYLRAQALTGLEQYTKAVDLLNKLLQLDSSHAGASDLIRLQRSTHFGVTS